MVLFVSFRCFLYVLIFDGVVFYSVEVLLFVALGFSIHVIAIKFECDDVYYDIGCCELKTLNRTVCIRCCIF